MKVVDHNLYRSAVCENGKWNLNFTVVKEDKIDWNTEANINVATVTSANETDADPVRTTNKKR